MSVSEPEHLLVARDVDVEPLVRTTRSQLAQLALQVRAAMHEAEELAAELAEDDASARDLLRASLDELIESRRRELEQALEQELVRAATLSPSDQEDVAWARFEVPEEPGPSRRLKIVAEAALDEADHPQDDADPPQEEAAGAPGEADPPWDDADPPQEEAAGAPGEVDPPWDDAGAAQDDAGAPQEGADAPEEQAGAQRAGEVPSDPALLRELVSAAVTAAVGQAVQATSGVPRPSWVAGPYQPTTVHHVPAHGPRSPLRRRLLHVDVVLPLVLVVIVFVILLAWVG